MFAFFEWSRMIKGELSRSGFLEWIKKGACDFKDSNLKWNNDQNYIIFIFLDLKETKNMKILMIIVGLLGKLKIKI